MATSQQIEQIAANIRKFKPELVFDLSGSTVDGLSVKVKEQGDLEQKASQRTSATLRVWNSVGQVGVVNLTSLETSQLIAAVDIALAAADLNDSEESPDTPLLQSAGELHPVPLINPTAVGIDELGSELLKGFKKIKESHPAVTGVPYNIVSQNKITRFYLSSTGILRHQKGLSVSSYLYPRGQETGFSPRLAGESKVANSLATLDLPQIAKTAFDRLVSHLKPGKIPSGQYPVIFSGRAFVALLNAFSNLFNAPKILDKQSLHSKESLGTQIASPILNIDDDPFDKANADPTLFDDEGTAVRRTPLVVDGFLRGLWHHSLSAKAFGTALTGHARVAAKMQVGQWFFSVAPGTGLGPIAEDCVWIDELEAIHAGVNALEGSFSLPFLGYRISNGQKLSLEGVTVAGDFRTLLKSICAIDSTRETDSEGISPAVAIPAISITCSAQNPTS